MKKINQSKFSQELPPLFQRIKIRAKKKSTYPYLGTTSVRKLNSTQVDCGNFHRPISKLLILPDEI